MLGVTASDDGAEAATGQVALLAPDKDGIGMSRSAGAVSAAGGSVVDRVPVCGCADDVSGGACGGVGMFAEELLGCANSSCERIGKKLEPEATAGALRGGSGAVSLDETWLGWAWLG